MCTLTIYEDILGTAIYLTEFHKFDFKIYELFLNSKEIQQYVETINSSKETNS